MRDWTDGYVADIGYTYGYYTELNPQRIKLAFLNQRLVFPVVGAACELGFGQGLSANIHAAASVVEWYGCLNSVGRLLCLATTMALHDYSGN